MRKFESMIRLICLLFSLVFIMTSCSSVHGYMHETTAPEIEIYPEEEYFTSGDVICRASGNLGIAYEGLWIYVETITHILIEDNPDTPYDDSARTVFERLVKYNPKTDTVSSLCINPTCMHSSEDCPFFAPQAWMVSYFDIFGDWMLYTFMNNFAEKGEVDSKRTYLFNLKTGEHRQLHASTKEGEMLSRTTSNYVMNGKVYSTLFQFDYTGEEEFKASGGPGTFEPKTYQYIEVYDPESQKIERLFEVPEDMLMIGMTNKRFLFMRSDMTYWSCDYKGENMKLQETLNFDIIMASGKYAYPVENPDYKTVGYNYRGYDLSTDSMFNMDFGCEIRNFLVDSNKLVFTTFSRIDEFKEFAKKGSAYIRELYPDITDPEEIVKIQSQMRNSIQYDGTFQIYITDARGENKKLVFEGENMNFTPLRISGNHLYGYVSYGDPNNNFAVTYPGNKGRCAINLETGEITLIPQLELHLDQ